MNLDEIIVDVANTIVEIDRSGQRFRTFQAGAGPFGEPQLVKLIAVGLNQLPKYRCAARTMRTPDLLIQNEWALEFKITRPFGDNGKEAESWSVNLLHPYAGNVSTIGDCYKLRKHAGTERKGVIVIGYEHIPAKIDLQPLVDSFEAIAKNVAGFNLSRRIEHRHEGLVHPFHQCLRLFGWELIERDGTDNLTH